MLPIEGSRLYHTGAHRPTTGFHYHPCGGTSNTSLLDLPRHSSSSGDGKQALADLQPIEAFHHLLVEPQERRWALGIEQVA